MEEILDDILDEIDEEDYYVLVRVPRLKRFHSRRSFNYWDDSEFYTRFTMSKQCAWEILDQIRMRIEHKTTWNNAISAECMFLLTLRFYTTGSFLLVAGDLIGVSKSSACRIVKNVSHYIALLRKEYIKMPDIENEKNRVIQEFYNIARFPRVIAAMDCSHVRIQSPGGDNAELFRNRKGYFLFNVQTLCDASLKIMDIVARWPGASHDSTIFNNSKIQSRFEAGEFGNCIILADGGYQCRSYVMTPLRNCTNNVEQLYNESQIRTRNCVERSYGVWRRRFPVLATGLRLNVQTIQSVIISTAILHNVCIKNNNCNPPPLEADLESMVNMVNSANSTPMGYDYDTTTRRALISEYFHNLIQKNGED